MADEQTLSTRRRVSGFHIYGLRDAKNIIAGMRREMASDPLTRRSADPFIRGQRTALNEIEARITRLIANIQDQVSGT